MVIGFKGVCRSLSLFSPRRFDVVHPPCLVVLLGNRGVEGCATNTWISWRRHCSGETVVERGEEEGEDEFVNPPPPQQQQRVLPLRFIPKSEEEAAHLRKQQVFVPSDPRSLVVAVIGSPNSGKSTLTNILMGWRVCSVSKKVHTTKRNTKAVLVEGDTQIVFLDTPGLVSLAEKRRHNLELKMVTDPKSSLSVADLVMVLVDASNIWTRNKLDPKVMRLLDENRDMNSILVLNKVDLVRSKRQLLDITHLLTEGSVDGVATAVVRQRRKTDKPKSLEQIFRQTERLLGGEKEVEDKAEPEVEHSPSEKEELTNEKSGWSNFKRVFMISALDGHGVEDLKDYLLESARCRNWAHLSNAVTDQSAHEIGILAVREKLLDALPKEIPYLLDLKIDVWEVDTNGILKILIAVRCPEKNLLKLVIGPGGRTVGRVADEARQELMNTFRCEVSLKLAVEYLRVRRH